MSFTTIPFWYFLIILYIVYWLTGNYKFQNVLLIFGGCIFIGWIQNWYILLISFITFSSYFCSLALFRVEKNKKTIFFAGLIANLSLLVLFKYFVFLGNNFINLFSYLGIHLNAPTGKLLLPLGISFYIFQATGYLIDVYRGRIKAVTNFMDFALFICFFPLLSSGPIERARNMIPQIQNPRTWDWKNLEIALPLFIMGLLKKMVIADNISLYVDKVFTLSQPTYFVLFSAAIAFALQVYTDFSAYTDIARGCARLFGFNVLENFNSPYLALSPIDFWRRWHISLSSWFRDYVFFPLERARRGGNTIYQYGNTILVFLLTGLWHGAAWNFILWGLYYGVIISIYNYLGFGGNWKPRNWATRLTAWLISIILIIFGWILFRAPSVAWLGRTLSQFHPGLSGSSLLVGIIIMGFTAVYSLPLLLKYYLDKYFLRWPLTVHVYYAAMIVLILILRSPGTKDFIYFQF